MRRTLAMVVLLYLLGISAAFSQDRLIPWDFDPTAARALKSSTDVLGEEVLAMGEPSFDRVSQFFPAMKRPRAIVGVKEHPDFIGVDWDGTLELGVAHLGQYSSLKLVLRLGDPPSPYDIEGPVTRSLLGGYLPVVETEWQFDGLLYKETVLGYSENFSPDAPLWAYVRLTATNSHDRELGARVTVFTMPALGGEVPTFSARVPAHQQHDFYLKIPHTVDPQRVVIPIEAAEFDRIVGETKNFWDDLLNRNMQIQTPETRVNDAYRAWLMYNFMNVQKIKGQYEIHDGRPFYEQIYGYSAGLYCDALSRYGYWKESEKYLESMLATQHPDGEYITIFGMPDNGALLFALAQQYGLSGDLAWFKTVAPRMVKSCDWIRRSRASTKVAQGGTKPITYGLLPPAASYCDFQAPVYSYLSDSYNWLGMHESALAFAKAGMKAEAETWGREADEYRDDILASMQAALVNVGGYKALPVEPITQRLLKEGGGDYYGLSAPEILETEIFAPNDPRAAWITRYMDEGGGLILGLDRFADGVDHAYTYGYALTQLRNGNPDKFLLTFYSTLAYGMARGTYSSVEVSYLPYGMNELTLPHTYSNTQQLRLLRLMLVRREGEDLLLASGTPRAWLEPGKTISVHRAPTGFGLLSFSLAADASNGQIRATIEPFSAGGDSAGSYPGHVKLWLRGPKSGVKPKQIVVNGRPWSAIEGETVELPGSTLGQKVEVVAQY